MATSSAHGGRREGSGRKTLGDKKTISISVSLPPDLRAHVDAIAMSKNKSRSSVIVDLIRKALA